jgi:hypothetical protein
MKSSEINPSPTVFNILDFSMEIFIKKHIDRESEANSLETSTFKERLSVETLKLIQEK